MPSWNDITAEMQQAGVRIGTTLDVDGVRRAKIAAVEQITQRPLIIYAVDMATSAKTQNNPLVSLINYNDKDAFIEALHGIDGDQVDVLLQSPGGLAEATESIVVLLRNRFKHMKFIVPSMAKSAATMLALSGDEIYLGVASELGPIDPQMPNGRGGYAPAQAILDQFAQAKAELSKNPQDLPVWLPILQQYAPSLLQECQNHLDLAEQLVSTWLTSYMFAGDADADARAKKVAKDLNDHSYWKSHGRRVGLSWLRDDAKLKVVDLADQPDLEQAIRALHIAINISFMNTLSVKIVENCHGGAFISHAQMVGIQLVQNPPNPIPRPPATPSAPSSTPGQPGKSGQQHRQPQQPRRRR